MEIATTTAAQNNGTGRSTRAVPKCPRNWRLLQRTADGIEVRPELGTETVRGGDDRNRDTCCDQAILDAAPDSSLKNDLMIDMGWFRPGLVFTEPRFPLQAPVQEPTEIKGYSIVGTATFPGITT